MNRKEEILLAIEENVKDTNKAEERNMHLKGLLVLHKKRMTEELYLELWHEHIDLVYYIRIMNKELAELQEELLIYSPEVIEMEVVLEEEEEKEEEMVMTKEMMMEEVVGRMDEVKEARAEVSDVIKNIGLTIADMMDDETQTPGLLDLMFVKLNERKAELVELDAELVELDAELAELMSSDDSLVKVVVGKVVDGAKVASRYVVAGVVLSSRFAVRGARFVSRKAVVGSVVAVVVSKVVARKAFNGVKKMASAVASFFSSRKPA